MVFDNTGKIILVKNLIFKDFNDGKIEYNYDKRLVRPCLVISELEDKRYILPITSSKNNEKYLYKNLKIYKSDLVYETITTKQNYIKLDQIISIEPYYKEPVDELEKNKYYECLKRLRKYYENIDYVSEEYETIKKDISRQLKKIKSKLSI